MKRARYYIFINDELERAEKLHPIFPRDLIHMIGVMGEEAGESMQAALNHVYHGDSLEKVKTELIQTGAMVVRCLENIERCENEKIDFTDFNSQPCIECGAVVCGMECAEGAGPGRCGSGDDGEIERTVCRSSATLDEAIDGIKHLVSDQGELLADE